MIAALILHFVPFHRVRSDQKQYRIFTEMWISSMEEARLRFPLQMLVSTFVKCSEGYAGTSSCQDLHS